MNNRKKALVIINPISGTGSKDQLPTLVTTMLQPSIWDVLLCFTEYPGHATELAHDAITEGYHTVVAIGGDGTINEVASALVDTDVALGIVPCGSGNGLGRHLHISNNAHVALSIINEGHVEKIDYCTVNSKPFFCTSGVGFDAQVSANFAQAGTRGMATYMKTTINTFFKYRGEDFKLTIDGKVVNEKAFVITCCNAAQYGNNAFIAPRASIQDGLIDVTVIHNFNFVNGSILGLRMLTNHLEQDSHVKFYRGKHIIIERPTADIIQIDGDPQKMPARLEFNCVPKGLNVIVPTSHKKSI